METWILFLVIAEIGLSHGSNICAYGSCYGNRHVDFITPWCNGSKIAIQNLIVGSKNKTLGCPQHAHGTGFTPPREEDCCYYNETDCTERYIAADGEEISSHYLNCTGQTDCMVNVAWTDRPGKCDTGYMDQTNYMVMEYTCISDVINVCQNSMIKGKEVYLFNPGYPNKLQPGHSGCSCSVETCVGSINVTVLDMRLSMNSFNACIQAIQLTDTGQTVNISCDHNNKFLVQSIYSSTDRFLELSLQNDASSIGGNFWIGFNSSHGEDVILSCGSVKSGKTPGLPCTKTKTENSQVNSESTSDSTCAVRGPGPSIKDRTTVVPEPPTTTGTGVPPEHPSNLPIVDKDGSSSKDNTAVIAGVVSALAAAGAAAGLGALARRKFLKNRVKPEDSPRQPIMAFDMSGAPSGVAPAGTSLA